MGERSISRSVASDRDLDFGAVGLELGSVVEFSCSNTHRPGISGEPAKSVLPRPYWSLLLATPASSVDERSALVKIGGPTRG